MLPTASVAVARRSVVRLEATFVMIPPPENCAAVPVASGLPEHAPE